MPAAIRRNNAAVFHAAHLILALMLAGGSACARTAEAALLASWTQYGPLGKLEARVITDGSPCPALEVDGHEIRMQERAAPRANFDVRICSATLAAEARHATIAGAALPLQRAFNRVAIIGDTGCRIEGRRGQNCNDPAAWPYGRIAARLAAIKPDLVIHLGDYHYRESPCPAGNSGCTGSPWGDNWAAWQADFFAPAKGLLAAAPWIMVRGNHEECARAGQGWALLLAPESSDTGSCIDHSAPYAVPFGNRSLVIMDNANAPDKRNDKLVPLYRDEFAGLAQRFAGPLWLLMHRPLRGVLITRAGVTGGNETLLAAAGPTLPSQVDLLLAGHIHTFEAIAYNADLPPQVIVGTGGDWLVEAPADLTGIKVGGVEIRDGFSVAGFGFLVMTRNETGWLAEAYNAAGVVKAHCTLGTRSQFDCKRD